MSNSRLNMSQEVERDFCDISARRKCAAYKYAQDSENIIKSLSSYLVLGTSVSSLCIYIAQVHLQSNAAANTHLLLYLGKQSCIL